MMRIVDITASVAGLILLSPLLALVAVLVKLSSPGPVFYRAIRVGQNGVPFRLYKFRSMRAGADRNGPGITVAGDDRITPLGAFLRRYKLDELPQLLNVLRGEMSLVGPRPEDPRYLNLELAEHRRVLSVKPGITGVASLTYRNEEAQLNMVNWESFYRNELLPKKLALELGYLERRSVWSDLGIILRTLKAIFVA